MQRRLGGFGWKAFGPIVLASFGAVAVALSGCSSSAMKSAPLWEGEYEKAYGPPEDRVNLWPLLYYRKPALSLLWPFIAITDEGHAVIPFYEYRNGPGELRIGTVHQAIPALIVSNSEEEYFRAVNVVNDRKDQFFTVFPLFFRNGEEKWWLIVPLFYHDERGFWSPLVTWFKKTKGFLGPLFFHSKESEWDPARTYFPFPILGLWRGARENGWIGFPFVYWNRKTDGSTLNVGVALFDRRTSGGDRSIHYLFPLGGHVRESGTIWNYLIPFWWSKTEESRSCFVSLPYIHQRRGEDSWGHVFLNLYTWSREDETFRQGVVWPLFRREKSPAESMNTLFPLWYSRTKEGRSTFVSLPYLRFAREHSTFTNLLLLAYLSYDKDDSRYASILFPIVHRFSNPKASGHAVFPLYLWKRSVEGVETFLSPLMSIRADGSLFNFAGPVFHYSRREAGQFLSVVWPLFVHQSGENGTRHWTIPFYYFIRDTEGVATFYSALASFRTDGGFLNILGPVFHRSTREEGNQRTAILWPFCQWWSDKESASSYLFPLFFRQTYPAGDGARKRLDLLGPLYYSDTSPDRAIRSVLFPFWIHSRDGDSGWNLLAPLYLRTWSEQSRRFFTLPLSWGRTREGAGHSKFVNVAGLLAHWSSTPRETTLRLLLPLIKITLRHEGGLHNRVFPLYCYDSDPTRRELSLLLGLLYSGERELDSIERMKAIMRYEFNNRVEKGDATCTVTARRVDGMPSAIAVGRDSPWHWDSRSRYEYWVLIWLARFRSTVDMERRDLPEGGNPDDDEILITGEHGRRQAQAPRVSKKGHVFPLFSYESKEDRSRRFNLLWRLYDSKWLAQSDGTHYSRHRVLWRLYHRETLDDDVAVDVFPFITWDRGKEKKKFSFAGGFVGFGRDGEERHVKVLWIPIRWGGSPKE